MSDEPKDYCRSWDAIGKHTWVDGDFCGDCGLNRAAYEKPKTVSWSMQIGLTMAASDKKCEGCKRAVHKSALQPGKYYCSWCRKYA